MVNIYVEIARAIGGLLSIIALIGLLSAEFWLRGRTLSPSSVIILLTLISSLLAVDVLQRAFGGQGGQ